MEKDSTILYINIRKMRFYTSNLRYKKAQIDVGNDILSEENMRIYPNPCEKIVHLEINCDEDKMMDITLWTVEAKLLSKQEALSLAEQKSTLDFNAEKLSLGIYFLRVKTIII